MHTPLAWWVGFNLAMLALLGFDLGVLRRKGRAVGLKEALGWTVFWMTLALAFGGAIAAGGAGAYEPAARDRASLEFFTAYLVEQSLSLDNVFIFAILLRHFRVPAAQQHGVLFWGVLGAMVLRLGMIVGGLALLRRFEWVLYGFGAFLIWSAWRTWRTDPGNIKPEKISATSWLRRFLPMTEDSDGARFFIRRNGRWLATPLFAVLITLELCDVLFAFDSVPAVLAVTHDPFLAYTSNVFAILGLRSLYFLLAGVIERCWMLHYGLALLLGFIGVKMLAARWYDFPLGLSLAVIGVLLGGSIAGSLLIPRKKAARG
jgi:tellurite resistance protein TerC